jgi:hypothetical protein
LPAKVRECKECAACGITKSVFRLLLVAGFRLGWMDRQVIGFGEFWP